MEINRRSFLALTALAGAAGRLEGGPAERKEPPSPAEFRRRLVGPILSNPTPFQANFEVDYQGLRNLIARALRYGVPIFASTAGNSQYDSLTYDEIKEVTRVLVEAVGGRGLTIGATAGWWTAQVVDYCRHAESVGADAVQVMAPTRHSGDDSLVRHFETIAKSTRLPLVLHGNYSEPLLRRLVKIDSIVALKEDLELTYYIDRQIEFGDRLSIFAGGAETRFLVGYPYGSKAFFSTYTTFAPDISMRFWKAIREGDLKRAVEITTKYDHPFIKQFTHEFWHATLEYFGVAQRYLRPPQRSYSDAEMKGVKAFFDRQGLDPRDYK
jgi:5-dehydro-4-deoxyglucarate dehydratase